MVTLRPTFADLQSDPKFKDSIRAAEAKHGTPLPEPIQHLLVDIAVKSTLNVQTRVEWITRLKSISNSIIASNAHSAEYPLFWIYLYGVVIEFYDYLDEHRYFYEKVRFLTPIIQSVDAMRTKLSEEDISFIRYMRHSHVHISLDYIWHKAKMKDGKLSAVQPPYDPDAIDISQKIIAQHGGDQQAVARTYSLMIFDDLINLERAALEAIQ